MQKIELLKNRAETIIENFRNYKLTLAGMHVDDSFTNLSNAEILETKTMIKQINEKVDNIIEYVNSKGILVDIDNDVELQYKQKAELGNYLKAEYEYADKVYDAFENKFEDDYRLGYLHIGMIIALIFAALLLFKISRIEKVKTIT